MSMSSTASSVKLSRLMDKYETRKADQNPDVRTTPEHEKEQDTSEHDDETSGDDDETSDDDDETAHMQREALGKFQAGKLNLESEADVRRFEERYKNCLTGGLNGDTLVHLVLREYEDENFSAFRQLLEICLRLMPTILEERNERGETPLHLAIERRVGSHLKWLVSETPRAAQAIACTGPNNGNCLHAAIRRKESHVRYLIEMCDASSIMAQDRDGCTPLHYAVDARYSTIEQLQVVKDLLAKCPGAAVVMDKTNSSPFKVSKRSWVTYERELEAKGNGDKIGKVRRIKFGLGLEAKGNEDEIGETRRMEKKVSNRSWANKYRWELEANRVKRYGEINLELGQKIRNYLKAFILREFDLDTSFRVLYDEGKELELVFDLTAYASLTPGNLMMRLRNMQTFLRFDHIIARVSIPELGGEDESQDRGDLKVSLSTDKPHIDIAPQEAVIAAFDLLRKCGVDKIVRVAVGDRGNPYYDDDTIEAALSGFDVDDLDWGTQDVCAETIKKIAPNVKTLKLYPSGNNGVLRSWSASDGLVGLSQLREVTLVVGNTVQSRERTRHNIESFRIRLDRESQGMIRIIVNDTLAEAALPTNPDAERRHKFLETLSHIATTLNASQGLKGSKIALIEDGVEPMSRKVGEKIAKGRSFVHLTDGQITPWWGPSSGRGSAMAEILCEYADPVELYVARVGVNPDKPDAFVPSVVEAIRWALSLNVDVICLGDLSGASGQADEATATALSRALVESTEKDIVFMTVARPRARPLESEGMSRVPYQTIFRIDSRALRIAASNSGERAADFLFPGQYTAPVVTGTMLPSADLDPDSVSLSLAASLAAQCLNLRRRMRQEAGEDKSPDHAARRVRLVKKAFKRFGDKQGNVWLDSHATWLNYMADVEVGEYASRADRGNLSS